MYLSFRSLASRIIIFSNNNFPVPSIHISSTKYSIITIFPHPTQTTAYDHRANTHRNNPTRFAAACKSQKRNALSISEATLINPTRRNEGKHSAKRSNGRREIPRKNTNRAAFNKRCNNKLRLLEREGKHRRKIEDKYIFNVAGNIRYSIAAEQARARAKIGRPSATFFSPSENCTLVSNKGLRRHHPPPTVA